MRLALVFIGLLLSPCITLAADLGTEAQKQAGKELYTKYCTQCHGDAGDGKGVAAPYFKPLPRDFTSGKYKIRTTANGELPTDEDIFLAIKKGLAFKSSGAYTVMPPWPYLTDSEIMNLVYYLKAFSSDFTDPEYNNPKRIAIPSPIPSSEESITKGRKVFEDNECVKCHGNLGRGDGRSAPTLEDDWEQHIRPADLTMRWTYRGGSSREDIFRTVTTGFNGTPMPAYAETISEEDRWHLVNYIYSLRDRDEPEYTQTDSPIRLVPVSSEIDLSDFEAAKALFQSAPEARIPVVGQVIEPGRALSPGINQINVRAIYNTSDVAFLLTWHDMVADTEGAGGPELEVPRFEPATEEESDDPFGDEEEEDPFAEEEEGDSFADAVAIQFPSNREEKGFAKPYLLFGDSQRPVDLWFMNLASNDAQIFSGKGSDSLTLKEGQDLSAASKYMDGKWAVIMKRTRVVEDVLSFNQEESFLPIALSVWDGFNEERGNKRGITSWFSLYQAPMEKPSVVKPMLQAALGLLLLELLFIWWMLRKKEEDSE